MKKIVYFKTEVNNWIKHLIKSIKQKDEIEILDENNEDYFIKHERSGYTGWLRKSHFTHNKEDKIIKEVKKIKWDE